MLSIIVTNVLIVSNVILGIPGIDTHKEQTKSSPSVEYKAETQKLYPTGKPLSASRDAFTVKVEPVVKAATLNARFVTEGHSGDIVSSAMKYVGYGWDCTMLVEQALRDMGHSVPDLGPMGFGAYGTVFYDPSQVQPGDILMRNGHVAIYAGNGMLIQGGYGNQGVVFNGGSPENFSVFVRIG
jgi:cell wall-associated NlpC family hydrolase